MEKNFAIFKRCNAKKGSCRKTADKLSCRADMFELYQSVLEFHRWLQIFRVPPRGKDTIPDILW